MNQCQLFKQDWITTCYFGETHRSLKERASEHHKDGRNKPEGSHMAVHQASCHPNQAIYHKFSIVRACSTPLERQLREYVVIKLAKFRGTNITNIKQEYNRCSVPQLQTDQRPKEQVQDDQPLEHDEQGPAEGDMINKRCKRRPDGNYKVVKEKGARRLRKSASRVIMLLFQILVTLTTK